MRIIKRFLPLVITVLGLGILYPMQTYIDRSFPHEVVSEDSLYFASGKAIKRMSVGLEALVADVYWIRTIQYFGRKLLAEGGKSSDARGIRLDLLAPLLNIIVTLDPHDILPYRFGALFLPDQYPDKAIQLLKDGIKNNPDEWRLYQDLGYIYWHRGDFQDAADMYSKGGSLPGALWWMRDLAGAMRIKGGSRATARAIYSSYLDSEDKYMRYQAGLRVNQIDAMDQMDAINALLAEYRRQRGRCPKRLSELSREMAAMGLSLDSAREPLDPVGIPYTLNETDCKVELSVKSPVLR